MATTALSINTALANTAPVAKSKPNGKPAPGLSDAERLAMAAEIAALTAKLNTAQPAATAAVTPNVPKSRNTVPPPPWESYTPGEKWLVGVILAHKPTDEQRRKSAEKKGVPYVQYKVNGTRADRIFGELHKAGIGKNTPVVLPDGRTIPSDREVMTAALKRNVISRIGGKGWMSYFDARERANSVGWESERYSDEEKATIQDMFAV